MRSSKTKTFSSEVLWIPVIFNHITKERIYLWYEGAMFRISVHDVIFGGVWKEDLRKGDVLMYSTCPYNIVSKLRYLTNDEKTKFSDYELGKRSMTEDQFKDSLGICRER